MCLGHSVASKRISTLHPFNIHEGWSVYREEEEGDGETMEKKLEEREREREREEGVGGVRGGPPDYSHPSFTR